MNAYGAFRFRLEAHSFEWSFHLCSARRARARISLEMRKGAFADGPDVTVAVRRLTFCGASRRIGSSGEEVARLRARRPLRRSREVRGVSAGVLGRRKPVMVAGGSPRV